MGRESSAEFFEYFVTWWGNFANLKWGGGGTKGGTGNGGLALSNTVPQHHGSHRLGNTYCLSPCTPALSPGQPRYPVLPSVPFPSLFFIV